MEDRGLLARIRTIIVIREYVGIGVIYQWKCGFNSFILFFTFLVIIEGLQRESKFKE